MKKNLKKTQYSKKIRVTPNHLKWLKTNKTTKTIAGFLAKIIEDHIKSK